MSRAGHIAAVVPAAGLSERMGHPKALLEIGGVSAIERVAGTLREAGVEEVMVVAGKRPHEIISLAGRCGARCVINKRVEDGMFSSVRTGLCAISREARAVLVLPADIPLVRRATVGALIDRHLEAPDRVLVPRFTGRRGHPVLLPSAIVVGLRDYDGPGGLKDAISFMQSNMEEVAVPDRFCLRDMDTPGDYEDLRAGWKRYDVPDVEECEIILDGLCRRDSPVRAHGRAVAAVAGALADALNGSGCPVDRELVRSAALLHDMVRDRADHAREAARLLETLGFRSAAAVVESHMDISPGDPSSVSEAEVLYLADKLVLEERIVSLEERFAAARRRHAGDPEAASLIERRYAGAVAIREKIGAITGLNIAECAITIQAGAAL